MPYIRSGNYRWIGIEGANPFGFDLRQQRRQNNPYEQYITHQYTPYLLTHNRELDGFNNYLQNLQTTQRLGDDAGLSIELLRRAREILARNDYIEVDNNRDLLYYRGLDGNFYIEWPISSSPDWITQLKEQKELLMQLQNIEENDMSETIEVDLNDNVVKTIIVNLDEFSIKNAKEIKLYEYKLSAITKESHPDIEHRDQVKNVWETRIENALTRMKLADKLKVRFQTGKRPLKLQKNERKVLANVIDELDFNFSMVCPYSNISNINHPDRFYGFPSLEKSVKNKIAEVTNTIKNLTRSDVNVYVK